ncbi:glutathione ABC transporter substrate-binding protein [Ewingella americana]|uniref:Glutathione-binding protein GsiB n=1 Tax=Ewingella americana TaxID=41202 RepID=A0A502GTE5_9GAMM|nr:glutathione ABC transporter substrate-binding protein [Ewingella americana]TPG64688.1 glutathione ABC transporter substrate-binding protein [Ewingella americana]
MQSTFLRKTLVAAALVLSFSATAQAKDLRISMYADMTGFDPHDTTDTLSYSVQSAIFERLFQFDSKMAVVPVLATDYTSNSDATEFTINLRHDVTFQDGTPFNADAVKINLDRLANPANHLKRNALFSMIKSVDVMTPYQVKITLNKPFGAMINTLAHPSAVMHSPAVLKQYPNEQDLSVHPVGTGPFKFVEWQQGKDVKLVKYDNYWQKGWPKVDSVTLYPTPEDSTQVAKLKSGGVDAVYPLPSDLVDTVKSDPKLDISQNPGIYLYYIAFNTQKKEFSDVRVRQAINYAIDRNLWLKVGFAGLGSPSTSPLPKNVQFYEKQTSPDYSYNIAKAKALMKDAGYENGFDVELWSSNKTDRIRSGQFLKQQLSLIGVRVKLVPMDSGSLNQRLWSTPKPADAKVEMYYGAWSASTGDADWALRPLFATESWIPTGYNVSYYSNKQVDEAITAGLQTADPAKRKAAYADAQKLLWADAPMAYLGVPDNLVGKSKDLSGVYMLADGSLIFNQAEFK